MVVKVKMRTTGKIFGKSFLKFIRDASYPKCYLQSRQEQSETSKKGTGFNFLVRLTSNRRKRFKILSMRVTLCAPLSEKF